MHVKFPIFINPQSKHCTLGYWVTDYNAVTFKQENEKKEMLKKSNVEQMKLPKGQIITA